MKSIRFLLSCSMIVGMNIVASEQQEAIPHDHPLAGSEFFYVPSVDESAADLAGRRARSPLPEESEAELEAARAALEEDQPASRGSVSSDAGSPSASLTTSVFFDHHPDALAELKRVIDEKVSSGDESSLKKLFEANENNPKCQAIISAGIQRIKDAEAARKSAASLLVASTTAPLTSLPVSGTRSEPQLSASGSLAISGYRLGSNGFEQLPIVGEKSVVQPAQQPKASSTELTEEQKEQKFLGSLPLFAPQPKRNSWIKWAGLGTGVVAVAAAVIGYLLWVKKPVAAAH